MSRFTAPSVFFSAHSAATVDVQLISVLGLGFLMGCRHAFDADHIAAVSALLSGEPSIRKSSWVGFWWGSGHTATLLAVGLAVLAFHVTIPDHLAAAFEFAVGGMLVLLGGSLAATIVHDEWHWHAHRHDGSVHAHLHHHRFAPDHDHGHRIPRGARPFAVGMMHGLAGSAAVILMTLSAVRSPWEGLLYILLFGVGSIGGMMLVVAVISVPLSMPRERGRYARMAVQGLASAGSVALGFAMMARIGFGA
jgi:high-affinity nickel permease